MLFSPIYKKAVMKNNKIGKILSHGSRDLFYKFLIDKIRANLSFLVILIIRSSSLLCIRELNTFFHVCFDLEFKV